MVLGGDVQPWVVEARVGVGGGAGAEHGDRGGGLVGGAARSAEDPPPFRRAHPGSLAQPVCLPLFFGGRPARGRRGRPVAARRPGEGRGAEATDLELPPPVAHPKFA